MSNYFAIMPAMIIDDGSKLLMNRCYLKGNKTHETLGILSKKADIIIKDSNISNHLFGGIHIY